MKAWLLLLAVLWAAPAVVVAQSPGAYTPEKGTRPVAVLCEVWHDAARERDVPVKIYYPAQAKAPCPVIIFSHGLGGSREGYEYLGRHWAACGFVCVHLQHQGSDGAVWKGAGPAAFAALKAAAADPHNAVNRVQDIHFAIDRVLALDHDAASSLHGFIDPEEIGMSGHSFGAWTTLVAVGEKTLAGDARDPRIKAAVAMSAPVPAGPFGMARQFTGIAVPVFHMTGTLDDSPIGDTRAAQRRIPFDEAQAPGTCLLILNGANHMTFAGRILPGFREEGNPFEALILAGSTAFWDATLRHDAAARHWLYEGGFAALLGRQGTFEKR